MLKGGAELQSKKESLYSGIGEKGKRGRGGSKALRHSRPRSALCDPNQVQKKRRKQPQEVETAGKHAAKKRGERASTERGNPPLPKGRKKIRNFKAKNHEKSRTHSEKTRHGSDKNNGAFPNRFGKKGKTENPGI